MYLGRDMETSHRGLGITEAEWEANREHSIHVLEQHGIGEPEQSEFLELFERYRAEIVEAPIHLEEHSSGQFDA